MRKDLCVGYRQVRVIIFKQKCKMGMWDIGSVLSCDYNFISTNMNTPPPGLRLATDSHFSGTSSLAHVGNVGLTVRWYRGKLSLW